MINIVKDTILRHSMLQKGDCVAVGLSGGADSVTLLSVLLELAEEMELTVRAIHINHGIRGQSADLDQRFCEELCADFSVKLDCFTLDIPSIAARRGIGLEECGRVCRYECFERIAREHGCRIATAHTLSDSAETVLFNLSRGSGLSGVCGIPPVRGNIIRPLINITREQVEEYCKARKLDYVTDETNTETTYRRNLIRSEVIPSLRQVNPAFHQAVRRFTQCAAEDDRYLDLLCSQELEKARCDGGWSARQIFALPHALQRRAIIAIAGSRNVVPEYAQVQLCLECLQKGSGAVVLRQNLRFSVKKGIIILDDNTQTAREQPWSVPLDPSGTLLPDGRRLVLTQIDLSVTDTTQKNHKLLFKNSLSCDIITFSANVSSRLGGDRSAPAGLGVHKLNKTLLCDEGIPAHRRGSLAIIADHRGILWVEGFGASELGRPRDDESIVLIPEITGDKENINGG